jgi:histidinol phosphatase-like enzyme
LRPGLFLDRDGVINEECEYLHDPKDLVVLGGVPEAIAAINRRDAACMGLTPTIG